MAVKPLKVNLQKLLKKYAQGKDNAKGIIKAITPVLKDQAVKREIAMRMIDIIIERTLEGKDKNGKDFKPYRDSYKKSLVFKIYKGRKQKPDLKLTGDMQASIDVVKITPDDIEIGFNDKLEADKAEGHVKGANYLPVRDFWGLPTIEEQKNIMEQVVKEHNDLILKEKIEFIEAAKEIPIFADIELPEED